MNTSVTTTDEPFHYVAVPQKYVPAVYQLLAELTMADNAPVSIETPAINSPTAWSEMWPDEKLARFAAGDTKTTQIAGEIMDVLAEQPENEPLTIDDLAERTGRPRSQVKALWTHVSRHLGKHYGTSHPPLSTKWGSELTPPRDNVVFYFLTAEQAQAWKRVRGA